MEMAEGLDLITMFGLIASGLQTSTRNNNLPFSYYFPFIYKWMQRRTVCPGLSVLEITSYIRGSDESFPAKSIFNEKKQDRIKEV